MGFFRDVTDCTVFYRCTGDGQTHRFNCPAGLVFDSRSGTCNWKNQVPECSGSVKNPQVNKFDFGRSGYPAQVAGRNNQGQQRVQSQPNPIQNNIQQSSYGNEGRRGHEEQGRTYQDSLRDMLINMPAISFPPDVLKPSFSTLSNTLGAGDADTTSRTQATGNTISNNGANNIITIFNPLTNKAEPFLVREIDPNLISPHLVTRFLSRVEPRTHVMFNQLPLKQTIHPFLKFQKPNSVHNTASHTGHHHAHRRQFDPLNGFSNVYPVNTLPNRPFVPANPLLNLGSTANQQQFVRPLFPLQQGPSQHSVNDILAQVLYPQMLNMPQFNPFTQPPLLPFPPQLSLIPNIPLNNETRPVLNLLYNLTAGSQSGMNPFLQYMIQLLLVGNPSSATSPQTTTPDSSNKITVHISGTVTLNAAALNLDHSQCTKVHHVLNTVLSSLVKSVYKSLPACKNGCVVNIPAIAVTC